MFPPANPRGLPIFLSLCFLYPAAPSEAQELASGRVVVVRAPSAEAARGAAIEGAVLEELHRRGLAASPPPPAEAPPTPGEDLPALGRARDTFASLHPEEAESLLRGILERAATHGALGLGHDGLVEAHLLGARVALALARPDLFAAHVDALGRIAPDVAPSPVDFPPAFIAAFEARRVAAPIPGPATLRWEGDEDLQVWVDGVRQPAGARSLTLPAGEHDVLRWQAGHVTRAERVTLEPGATRALAPLGEDPEAMLALGRDLDRPRQEVLDAARAADRCVLVVEVRPARDRWSVFASDPCGGHRTEIEVGAREPPRTIAAMLVADLLTEPTPASDRAATNRATRTKRRRRRAIGVAAAVAAIGAAVGAGLAATRSSSPGGFSLQWSRKGGP